MVRQESATKKMKTRKEEIRNTVKKNNPQVGERGRGRKDFARDLTELMKRERRKNYSGNYPNIVLTQP